MREKSLRIKAEKELQLSEERWKFILDSGIDDVWDLNIKDNTIVKSDNNLSAFGFMYNLNNTESKAKVHLEDIEQIKNDFQAHLTGETEFYSNKHRVMRDDGSWSWILTRGKIVSKDEAGNPLRMVGTNSDITEREIAALIYKNSSQAIFICNNKGKIINVNPAFLKITGYAGDEIIGEEPHILSSGIHDKEFYKQMWSDITKKDYWAGEIYNKRKNSEVYPGHLEINVVRNSNGAVDYYFAITNDTSTEHQYKKELKKRENYLLQQSRMAQMGEMLSMITHQWKQPLASISSTSLDLKMNISLDTFDLENIPQGVECYDYVKTSLKQIDLLITTLSTTVDDFKNFYKPHKNREIMLLNSPISKALQLIMPLLNSVKINVSYVSKSEKNINILENELIQVILNILKNAHDNFIDKNIINPKILIETKDTDNSSVVTICDNGTGIPESIKNKIFDSYFSTKDENAGTGLGLYMAKIIVEQHHNAILSVENKNDGVCFILEFFDN